MLGAEDWQTRTLADIRYIAVHRSAVDIDSTAMQIADYHVNVLKWPGIGYHFVVHWDGRIEYVGHILTVRANVAGRNREVVGICIPGNWQTRWPTDTALDATARLVAWLRTIAPQAVVRGHYELALPAYPTSCPGPPWPQWRGRVGG